MLGLLPGALDAGRSQVGGREGHVNRCLTALCSIILWEPSGAQLSGLLIGKERRCWDAGRERVSWEFSLLRNSDILRNESL